MKTPPQITLKEAFMQRFKERGFTIDSFEAFEEESRSLDEVYKKLLAIHRYNATLRAKDCPRGYSDRNELAPRVNPEQ